MNGKTNKLIVILLVILIIAVLGVGALIYFDINSNEKPTDSNPVGETDKDTIKKIKFNIDGINYEVDENTTFETWLKTQKTYDLFENNVVLKNTKRKVLENKIDVLKTDVIKSSIYTVEEINELKQVTVDTAFSYTVEETIGVKRQITIPQILNGGENSLKLNSQIAKEIISDTYSFMDDNYEIGIKSNFSYKIKNNIVIIYARLDYSNWPATGTRGLHNYNYFYDIENDSIITIGEALNKIDFPIESIKEVGANGYDDLDEACYAQIEINDEGDLKLHYATNCEV